MNIRIVSISLAAGLAIVSMSGCGGRKDSERAKDKAAAKRSGSAKYKAPKRRTPIKFTEPANAERYDEIADNSFMSASSEPLSTFSVDVDTASYANVRRILREGQWPTSGAVRIEEMINYFRYNYPQPSKGKPFSVSLASASCPWNTKHQLVRIGLQGRQLAPISRPDCNLVFLLDVSGSMRDENKLPLVQAAMQMLIERLSSRDRVAIVVYAGASGLRLPSTPANETGVILRALNRLQAGGSTNGGQGIQLAYRVAEANRIEGGINRVILCTDGDFNVGTTKDEPLVDLAKRKAKSGVTLSVLGFGGRNLNDSMMEKISNQANGNYNYIDTLNEARKVLIEQASSTLVTIAKDVKIQVDFNPAYVNEYRLIGYANRMLQAEDFKNDRKDAGDIGAGHQVTALYEIIPAGQAGSSTRVDPSEFQDAPRPVAGKMNGKMLTVRLRWKQPQGTESQETRVTLEQAAPVKFSAADEDFRFSAAVAAMGLVLRDSEYKGSADLDFVLQAAETSCGADRFGYRQEFIALNQQARRIAKTRYSAR